MFVYNDNFLTSYSLSLLKPFVIMLRNSELTYAVRSLRPNWTNSIRYVIYARNSCFLRWRTCLMVTHIPCRHINRAIDSILCLPSWHDSNWQPRRRVRLSLRKFFGFETETCWQIFIYSHGWLGETVTHHKWGNIHDVNVIDSRGVFAHTYGYLPAARCDLFLKDGSALVVGAHPDEVVCMNGLTVNMHLLFAAFYRPTPTRYKVMIEGHAFPSDRVSLWSLCMLLLYILLIRSNWTVWRCIPVKIAWSFGTGRFNYSATKSWRAHVTNGRYISKNFGTWIKPCHRFLVWSSLLHR